MSVSLIWKEPGIGSQQKLAQFKRELAGGPDAVIKNRKGIGHSGTLDPFAEGILCVGVGEGTKILSALVGLHKTYIAEMILGATSLTLDSESPLEFSPELDGLQAINEGLLESFLAERVGDFEQIPPQHSAVKIAGRRAFDYARNGEVVEIKPRQVRILAAKHLGLRNQIFDDHLLKVWRFELSVSSGTYIRSLARDWGVSLVSYPGTLNKLTRTHMGPWQMDASQNRLDLAIKDFGELIPRVTLTTQQAHGLRTYGRWDASWAQVSGVAPNEALPCAPRGYLAVDEAQPDVAVALLTAEGSVQRVFIQDPFGA